MAGPDAVEHRPAPDAARSARPGEPAPTPDAATRVSVPATALHPGTVRPQDLLALQRAAGNRAASLLLQRSRMAPPARPVQRDAVDMPAETITGDTGRPIEDSVSGLDELSGRGADPDAIEMERDPATVERNAPLPTDRLPYTTSGWDGDTILRRLGQYDRVNRSDSDAHRCVQAVALASHIPQGPESVDQYLNAIGFDGVFQESFGTRQRTALRVIRMVRDRVTGRSATYGDLAWAQEAVHDLFYDDVSGTPGDVDTINAQVTPTLDGSRPPTRRIDRWVGTAEEVMAAANALPAGGQLIVTAWTVVFNSAYDQVEEQGFRTRDRMRVEMNGRMVWIRRIDASRRPAATAIDFPSDSRSGHQLLILKGSDTAMTVRLYEPEVTDSGEHLITLSSSGGELARYLRDDPDNGIYGYIQLMGEVVPVAPGTSIWGSISDPVPR